MSLHRIESVEELRRHLHAALQLEHATIPPYLTALYSIHPGTNSEAFHIIRAVAVEEMLHMTLAGNLLNAVGGEPDFTYEGFSPTYPAFLPDGETDFQVDLRPFSKAAVETFLKIERPAATAEGGRKVRRPRNPGSIRAARVHDEGEEHFYSIGEFYAAIADGLDRLHAKMGDALFCGERKRQVTQAYYYSGGGEIVEVHDLASAKAAIRLISEQGEGVGGAIFDYENEIAHYYRFQQLVLGRYYRPGDRPDHPSGGPVAVDWDAVFPTPVNPRVADYPAGSDLRAAAEDFNARYAEYLRLLTQAFNGEPEKLIDAVGSMFRFKEWTYQLMRQPLGDGAHAAPTFEIPGSGPMAGATRAAEPAEA